MSLTDVSSCDSSLQQKLYIVWNICTDGVSLSLYVCLNYDVYVSFMSGLNMSSGISNKPSVLKFIELV